MNDLGPVLSTHPGRIATGGYFWYIGALTLVAGCWSVITGALAGDWGRAGSGVMALGLSVLLLVWPAWKLRQKLTAYQHGFVWERLFLAPIVLRWSEVRDVRVTEVRERRSLHFKGVHVEIDITKTDGTHLVVTNDLDNIESIQGYLRNGSMAPVPGTSGPGTSGPVPGAPPSPWG